MRKTIIVAMVTACLPLSLQAQRYADPNSSELLHEEGLRLLGERHYFASNQLLKHTDDEAATLLTKYFLAKKGASEEINKWLKMHPVHPMYDRLMSANEILLVKEGAYWDALGIYRHTGNRVLPDNELADLRLSQAISLINTNQADDAMPLLRQLKENKEHRTDVDYYTAYVLYSKGKYEEALPLFSAVQHSEEYQSTAPVYIADCFLQSNKPQRAYEIAANHLRNFPNTPLRQEINRICGEAYYDQGNYSNAIKSLGEYVKSADTPQRTALYKYGMSLLQISSNADAAATLSQCASGYTDKLAQNAWLHAGIAYINSGNKAQARMAFERASEMDFDATVQEEAFYNYALTLHDGATMGFGESVTAFETFLNKYPNSKYRSKVSQHLTEVYFTTKNYEAALASINKIKRPSKEILSASQHVLYHLGTQQYANGNYTEARRYLQQSLSITPSAEAYYSLGESEYRLGNYAAAAKALQSAVKLADKDDASQWKPLAYYTLGYSLFKQKKYSEALPNFQTFITTVPTLASGTVADQSLLLADAYNRLGDCQFTLRQYGEATAAYNSAIKANKANGDYSLLQLALINGLQGNQSQKIELLNSIGNDYSDSEYTADALFEKARALVHQDKRTEALATLQKLVDNYPQSPVARRALNEIGMINYELKDYDKAANAYTKVIEAYPNTTEAATALANLKDIYTEQGRVNEYAALALKAGQKLSPQELDNMVLEAALRANNAKNYNEALKYYTQLEAQTLSETMRISSLNGQLHAASALQDNNSVVNIATKLLAQEAKLSADVAAQTRLIRAQTYIKLGNTDAAVADYQVLTRDTSTQYGAQAIVELSQYAYDTKQYKSAEEILNRFVNSGTSHTYWLARAFVLLSDVFAQTDRTIEARQYLLSLKSNYTESEEINKMIEERLKNL